MTFTVNASSPNSIFETHHLSENLTGDPQKHLRAECSLVAPTQRASISVAKWRLESRPSASISTACAFYSILLEIGDLSPAPFPTD